MNDSVVIVGAGHAAGQLIASLKQRKYAGEIVLIGDEPYLPYQRPPLSKKFLSGELEADRLESERKLEREHARQAARQDVAAQAAQKARWRAFTKGNRSRPDKRDGLG